MASNRASNRTELAELTGLARRTVTSVVAELLADSSLVETDLPVTTSRRVGRPSRRLTAPVVDDLAVAVDFRHSHCRIGVLDRRGTRVLPVEVAYFDVDSAPEHAVNHLGATRVITEAGRQLGRALADLVNTLNPQMIVIGGELSLAGKPLLVIQAHRSSLSCRHPSHISPGLRRR